MQLFTRHWWTGVVWIIAMFLSAVWTLILTAPIHHRGSIGEQVMQCYISPNLMKKQTHQHLAWPEWEQSFSILSFQGELFLKCMHMRRTDLCRNGWRLPPHAVQRSHKVIFIELVLVPQQRALLQRHWHRCPVFGTFTAGEADTIHPSTDLRRHVGTFNGCVYPGHIYLASNYSIQTHDV